MKKIIYCTLFLSVMAVSLCGCAMRTVNSGEAHKYLIASMGFDIEKSDYKVTVEAVAVNSEDASGKKRILINGSGKTAADAMADAEKKATQPFNLSHCGVIVLGGGVQGDGFEEIYDYCYDTNEITFSVYMVSAENAAKLLKPEPVSSVAVGYDLMSIMSKETENSGIKLRNSLYEVAAEAEREDGTVKLPFFSISGDYREMSSLAVFKDNKLVKYERYGEK